MPIIKIGSKKTHVKFTLHKNCGYLKLWSIQIFAVVQAMSNNTFIALLNS